MKLDVLCEELFDALSCTLCNHFPMRRELAIWEKRKAEA
jgi:hypothetical protein